MPSVQRPVQTVSDTTVQQVLHSNWVKLSTYSHHPDSASFQSTTGPLWPPLELTTPFFFFSLFKSYGGGAYTILFTAEREDAGGGGEGGWEHAHWPWPASQERWRGSEPLRWIICLFSIANSKRGWIGFIPLLSVSGSEAPSHNTQVVCRGNCQLPWRLSEGQRLWSWTNPPREWTPIPGDPSGTFYWNTEPVRTSHFPH